MKEGRLPQVEDKFFEVEDKTLSFEDGLSEVDDKSGENLRRIRNDDSPSSSIAFGFHFLSSFIHNSTFYFHMLQ